MNRNNQQFMVEAACLGTSVVPKKQTSLPHICSEECNIQVTASLVYLSCALYCELFVRCVYLLRRMLRETSNSVIPESSLGRRREQQVTGWSGQILTLTLVRNSFGKLSLLMSPVDYCRALCCCRLLQWLLCIPEQPQVLKDEVFKCAQRVNLERPGFIYRTVGLQSSTQSYCLYPG